MESRRRTEAIVLAAGASSRLGRPKALLEFGARTALDLVLDALRDAGVTAGAVVVGEAEEDIRRAVGAGAFAWAHNPRPEAGRTGSVIAGLAALAPDSDLVLWPVDRPLASAGTVRSLLEAASAGAGVIVPEQGGRTGHPLVLRATLRSALLGAAPEASLRDVLRASRAGRTVVPVDDAGIHFNLDTPDAWREAVRWWSGRPDREPDR